MVIPLSTIRNVVIEQGCWWRWRKRVRQAEADQGLRPDLPTSEEREEIKRLRQENFELRRANEILKSASVFFAKELDPDRPK